MTMATAGETIYEWDKHPRMPVPAPPPGSCDCQFHIYEDPAQFPPRPEPPYPPITSATFAQAQKMHKAIGFDRGVIVHSAIYGSDHRLLLHALESLNDRDRYRGIGIVDDRVSDAELERLHATGVRGARFNFVRFLALDQREAEVRRSMARLRQLGWHARLHVHGDDLLNNSDLLRSIKDVPMVIDHWGTDWPHPQWKKRMMNDAEEVELLYRYVDGDLTLLRKILVDNPARLHGFDR
jgi:predicted TIM-barrel fold metal-dependent hydrolase